jgi:putative transposase
MINSINEKIKQVLQQGVARLERQFKRWTQPAASKQVIGTLADLKRSKRELITENLFLRQQLIVLERQVSRPKLTQRDRQVFVLLPAGSETGAKPWSW